MWCCQQQWLFCTLGSVCRLGWWGRVVLYLQSNWFSYELSHSEFSSPTILFFCFCQAWWLLRPFGLSPVMAILSYWFCLVTWLFTRQLWFCQVVWLLAHLGSVEELGCSRAMPCGCLLILVLSIGLAAQASWFGLGTWLFKRNGSVYYFGYSDVLVLSHQMGCSPIMALSFHWLLRFCGSVISRGCSRNVVLSLPVAALLSWSFRRIWLFGFVGSPILWLL